MFININHWFLAESFNLSTLRIPTPVETPANLKDIDWKDLTIVEEGDNGNNIINLGIQLPGEDKPNEGAVLDIQIVNDELYQPHIFLSDALQGAGLGYKIYLKFIHEFGHIYSGDGRRQNKTQIPAIFDKLKADGNIEAHRLPHGYLFILKNNPDRNHLVDKYVNKEKKMITTIDEFCSVNESSSEPRMMSFIIPEKKNWIEQGENVGIRFMGKTYWIKEVDRKFFEDNIGNSIGFKYFPEAMYIEMPTILKQNIVSKNESFVSESDLRNYSTLNKVHHLLKNDKITVYYFGPHDTPDTALKFDAKIVTPPYISRNNVEAVVRSIDPTGEKYLGDGVIWYKRGRWVHVGKWNARKVNKRILR